MRDATSAGRPWLCDTTFGGLERDFWLVREVLVTRREKIAGHKGDRSDAAKSINQRTQWHFFVGWKIKYDCLTGCIIPRNMLKVHQ